MGPREACERVEHDHHVLAELYLTARVLEHHVGHSDVPLVRQVEARSDHLAPAPIHHFAHLFGPLVHEQDEEDRRGMVERHALRYRLQHHRFSGLGRRHDQRPLAETQRADQVDDALDLRRTRARGLGGLEAQGARRMHGAELREIGPLRQVGRRPAVDAHHTPVLHRDEIAAPQSGETHAGIALGGQIAVGGDAYRAAVGGGVEPAGDGSQESSCRSITRSASSAIRRAWATGRDG